MSNKHEKEIEKANKNWLSSKGKSHKPDRHGIWSRTRPFAGTPKRNPEFEL